MARVKLDRTAALPIVTIKVGNINPASYQISLQLPGETSSKTISTSNVADLSTVPGVDDIDKLIGAELTWDVRVVRIGNSANEPYSIRVRIDQNGKLAENGLQQDTGEFGDLHAHQYFELIEFI